ncbi:MAG: serine/threonine-protein kinase [Myxococcota bacterium]
MAAPQLDRYVVEGELGQGGMSVVYRARDTKLPRPVAVKVLHDFLARQDEARHRFHREAVAVASLEHRAVLAIYDYSGPNASPSFIVTELIDGPTLRELVETQGPLPWPEMAMLVAAELASALAHAHQSGVVHRDIKPENVMIHRDGQLKLMDFGIAEMVGGSTQLTATGALIGSPAHMAPELIDGKRSDHRADVFSLGTLLYWLSTGSLPFAGPNPSALFKRILDGVYTPPQQLQPKMGNGLARIIARCLAPDPEQRLPTAQALHDALFEELQPLGLTPIETMSRRLLLDRDGFLERQTPLLLDGLVALGEAAVEERRLARASDAFNRVLAHDPEEPRARHWLETLRSGRRRRRRLAVSAALLLGVVGSAAGASLALRPAPPEAPLAEETPSLASTQEGMAAAASEAPISPPPEPAPEPPGAAPAATPVAVPSTRRPRPPVPVQEPPPVRATLTVQVGRAYADIYVDEILVADLKFRARVELTGGIHTVRVVRDKAKILDRLGLDALPVDRPLPQFGRFEARTIEVTEEGRLLEQREDGLLPLVDDVLLFKIPLTQREGRQIKGWISS